jgi:toxin CcdB
MAQFDVYANTNPDSKKNIPFLLDIQSDLLSSLSTRVVIPMIISSKVKKPINHLMPQFIIQNTTVVISTAELASISTRMLTQKLGSLQSKRNEIIAALDFLFTGI